MPDLAFRVDVLRSHGASGAVLDELLAYTRNRFAPEGGAPRADTFPLPDEPFVAAWEGYARESEREGVFPCLRERLVQLRFPVEAGIGSSGAYLASTRRGEPAPPGAGPAMRRPGALRLVIHPTAAGRIPVLVAADRSDFETLVRALTRRNEPAPLPPAMGACMVAGYNNWDRVAELQRAWWAAHPGAEPAEWDAAFRAIVPRKELYQDRFILLSRGPYSAVPAAELGLDREEWEGLSLRIRLEHECAHYFTRRVLGSMSNSLHDELIADSAGLMAARGRLEEAWLLRFLGLERFPAFRSGGRLECYRGDPPLSGAAFRVLQSLVVSAVRGLGEMEPPAAGAALARQAAWILAAAALSLEELASAGAPLARRSATIA